MHDVDVTSQRWAATYLFNEATKTKTNSKRQRVRKSYMYIAMYYILTWIWPEKKGIGKDNLSANSCCLCNVWAQHHIWMTNLHFFNQILQ